MRRGVLHMGFWWGKLRERALGITRRSWEDNIKTNLKEIGWEGMDWIDLTQCRDKWQALGNAVMKLQVP
jgi:hypothetical protein